MAFKELNGAGGNGGTVLKWDKPGQVVEGRLVATKRGKVFNGRPTTLAIIKQADGVDITIPLTTVLEARFIENEVQNGSILRITYTGKQTGPSSKMEYKAFKLEIDDQTISGGSNGVVSPGPSAAEVEAAKKLLASVGNGGGAASAEKSTTAPVSEYDRLLAVLAQSNPKGAAAIKGALESTYPEPERLGKLKDVLVQQGIKVDA